MSRLILDAGAFIAIDRANLSVLTIIERATLRGVKTRTSSPIVGQVWRNGTRQVNLARALQGVAIIAPDDAAARRAGILLAKTRTSDVVDALLADLCETGDVLLTSDPFDLGALLQAAGTRVKIVPI